MSTETMTSIERGAARLRWAVFAAMIVMAALYVAARFGIRVGHALVAYEVRGADSQFRRALGDGAVTLLMLALFRLTQMLRLIAGGDLFGAPVVARFRSFALWLLTVSLIELLAPFVAQLAELKTGNTHHILLSIDFREIVTVGITLLLFLLSRLLERARMIEDENREIV